MCISEFSKILVGDERMILCRKSFLKKIAVKKVVKKVFPECFGRVGFFKRMAPAIRIEECYEGYSSQFDERVGFLEANHDWEKFPLVALSIFKKNGVFFCRVIPFVP